MTVETESVVCSLCGGSIEHADKACPHCRASLQWRDYARAIEFARSQVASWRDRGLIGRQSWSAKDATLNGAALGVVAAAKEGKPFPPDTGLTSPGTCWRCARPIAGYYSYCNTCGAPLGAGADQLRYLAFVLQIVSRSGPNEMTLAKMHACASDAQEQIKAMRAELEQGGLRDRDLTTSRLARLRDRKFGESAGDESAESEGAMFAAPVLEQPQAAALPKRQRSIMEILLDPRNIHWLLGSGGGLLVAGLVIWLASLGVFRNALVVAGCMGAGTLVLLGSGCAVVKRTRYQTAGRALTLLACLVMPLNLWFYHAHDLVTLDGHLWAAAVVCCALYAGAAAVLEDAVFVYVLAAGVAMTGLLILADLHRLVEVAAPSTLLVSLGLIALHAERAFPVGDGPFSRRRFGIACFWSAQALLGAGLLLLLGAQVAGWLPMAANWLAQRPIILTEPSQQLLAIGLVAAGVYAYLYSDLVVRRVGIYIYFAAFALLWAEFLVIDFAHLASQPAAIIAAMAVTSLVINIAQSLAMGRDAGQGASKLARPLSMLGLVLASMPVALGIGLHLRAVESDVHRIWPFEVTWAYVGAMLLTGVCCRVSAYLTKARSPRVAGVYLVTTAAVVVVSLAGVLSLLGLKSWPLQSPVLMLIPIGYLIASRVNPGEGARRSLKWVAHLAAAVMLLTAISSSVQIAETVSPIVNVHANLMLSLFGLEAAAFYVAAGLIYGEGLNVYAATTMFVGSAWQLLNFWNGSSELYCLTFAGLGVVMLLMNRLVRWDRTNRTSLEVATGRSADGVMSLSLLATALMAMSRFAVDHDSWPLVMLLAGFVGLSLAASALARDASRRRWYVAMAVVEGALAMIIGQKLTHLSAWRHAEIFSVAAGLVLLVTGYGFWYREQEKRSEAASVSLLFGSVMAGLPLAIAAIVNRFGDQICLGDELALLTVSVLMFVTGFMCRLRSTTLVGGGLLVVHFAMMLVFVGVRAQLAVGVYLSIGGAALFGVGVVLSIYRDRLLQMPQRIKQHEGIFRVLAWR